MRRVLVVEDDPDVQNLIKEYLIGKGFLIKTANNGEEALHKFKADVFHAVVSDIKMPVLDGVGFLTKIKKIKPYMPFIIISGYAELLDSQKALEMGADDVMTKPIKFEDLANNITILTSDENIVEESPLDELYCEVKISEILEGKFSKYTKYLRLNSKKFIPVAKGGDEINVDRFNKYLEKGVETVHLLMEDYKQAEEEMAHEERNRPVTEDEKLELIAKSSSIIFDKIQKDGISEELLDDAEKAVNGAINQVTDAHSTYALFEMLAKQDDILQAHAVGCSVVATMIAKNLNIKKGRGLEEIALAAYMHDIGKTQLDKKIYTTPSYRLSEKEREEFKSHVKVGYELLREFKKLPDIVYNVAVQHHEECNGKGYPKGLRSNRISQASKIVALASEFCNLTIENPVYRYFKPLKAIRNLEKTKYDSFDPAVFAALKRGYMG